MQNVAFCPRSMNAHTDVEDGGDKSEKTTVKLHWKLFPWWGAVSVAGPTTRGTLLPGISALGCFLPILRTTDFLSRVQREHTNDFCRRMLPMFDCIVGAKVVTVGSRPMHTRRKPCAPPLWTTSLPLTP